MNKYIPCTVEEEKKMLKSIGVSSFEELIDIIPKKFRKSLQYDISDPLSEMDLINHIEEIIKKNKKGISFIGAGAYDRYIPSIIDFIVSRSEFYTAYTPYQPEVSQGTLQYLYEYQSMISSLSGMDISNASLYDCASALAEACLLSNSYNGRSEILISENINPTYVSVLNSSTSNLNLSIKNIPSNMSGLTNIDIIKKSINSNTSCVVIQSPNYWGQLENWEKVKSILNDDKILLIAISNPIYLSILKSPGDCGADIYIGEGQSLGTPVSYGGPYLGIISVKEKLTRKIPGRIVGKTTDINGKDSFVLTLQTREQHIRREKATSNICTNQGLIALRATIYLSTMGPKGLKEINQLSLQKAHYMAKKIDNLSLFNLLYKNNFIDEFLVETKINAYSIEEKCLHNDIHINPINDKQILFSVTEKRTKKEIDSLISLLGSLS